MAAAAFLSHLVPLQRWAPGLRETLVSWCEVNSGTGHPEGLLRMADVLVRAFRTLPGRIEGIDLPPVSLPGPRGTVRTRRLGQLLRIVVRPEAPRRILFSGHYDTVYDAQHPFQRCTALDSERLRGPGVADMKGGLLVLLKALECLELSPFAARLGYEILLGPDEEIGSPGSGPYLAEAARRHKAGVVLEAAGLRAGLIRRRRGGGSLAVNVTGRAAHTGRDPENGRNALSALCRYLLAAEQAGQEIAGAFVNVAEIQGAAAANVVPDSAFAVLGLRAARPDDAKLLERRLRDLADTLSGDGITFAATGGFTRPPRTEDEALTALFEQVRETAAALGQDLDWSDSGGGSDASNLSAVGLPTLDGLGPVGGNLHSPDEWILVPSLAERARLLALWLLRVAAGDLPWPPRAGAAG